MDDAFGAGLRRGAHHRHGAVDVGPQHRVRVGHPEPVVGGDVNHIPASGGRAAQRVGIGQVAGHDLGVQAGEVAPVAGGPRQQAQFVAARRQGARDGGADEAGRTGDQCGHRYSIVLSRALP